MYRQGTKWKNAWKRKPATPDDLSESQRRYMNDMYPKWPKFIKFKCNTYPDDDTKLAALGALHSVVALIAYREGGELIPASGTIIESYDSTIIVLTSANLIRRPTSKKLGENVLADNLKFSAHSFDGHSYTGVEVCAYDFHYNLAALKFISETPLPHSSGTSHPPLGHAKKAQMDDSIDVHSSRSNQPSFLLRPLLESYEQLTPGDGVIVLGRYFAEPFQPMVAPGEYWLERTKYDCKEVFMTNCKITRCGDGGPLINYSGKVIGVAFYDPDLAPCLPIQIAFNWWEHYKNYRKCCRPFLGLEATNLRAADLGIVVRVIKKFPDARKGIIIEKVIPDSPAYLAGLRVNDVIIQCGGKPIQSFLELFQMIWDKVGVPIELILVRADDVTPIKLNMVFVEATLDQLNRCERARYDCKELFMTNCKITRCGDGGPLINYRGEVIGLAFYDPDSSPCLPINIALKWWEHYKKYRKCCRPFLGFEATNLNAADLGIIARVIQKFPNAHKGVIIEKLIPDSAADLAGFHVNDVIIQCGEKRIQSLLELFEMIWEKVGVPMEVIVVRADNVAPIQLNMVFVEATLDQLYSWPANNNDDSD